MSSNQWNSGVNDRTLKEDICEIGRRVYNKGFAAANDGNISIRVGEDAVLCSPTMICKGFMKPLQIIVGEHNTASSPTRIEMLPSFAAAKPLL